MGTAWAIAAAGVLTILSANAIAQQAAPSRRSINARDLGAVGDGATDDTAAIQRALDQAGNGVVTLPAGDYRITGTLAVPQGGTLFGDGQRWENGATRLVVAGETFPAVRLSHAASVKALAICYPGNRDTVRPRRCPPAIVLNGINPSVEDIVFDCAWDGVSTVPGVHTGQALFRNLTGFVHNVGMHLSGIRDVVRIENVHWFVGGDDIGEKAYFRKHRVGFEMGDVDGVLMSQCFIIGGKTFFHQLPTKDTTDGSKQPAHSLGHHIDQCWIEDVVNGFVFEGTSGFVVSSANILVREGGVGVKVDADYLFYNAVLDSVQVRSFGAPIRGFEFGVRGEPHIRTRLSIADCQVVDGAPALRLMKGARRANVHDNHFQAVPGKPAIQIDPGADLLVITHNVLSAAQPIEDRSGTGARKVIEGNLVEALPAPARPAPRPRAGASQPSRKR